MPYFKNIIIIIIFNFITQFGWSQVVLSEVTVNKSKVFVGEAVELNVGIYTSTWFTKGVDIGNIKVNGAFSVYFRSLSTTKKINGKNYAGVIFIYNVFPFENQDIIIPSLHVEVETPKEGDYKGVRRTLKTKEEVLKIKPFPPGNDKSVWMVTNSMTVNEQWLGNTKNIKVGDVIERKITRRVNGTVAELIPPILWDTIPSVSMYPSQSDLNTNKSKTAISASRKDGVRYLFEEAGDVILPDMEFVWWNPHRNQFFKKTIKGLTVHVLPNPDLDMLKTAKEALIANSLEKDAEESERQEFLILGLSLKEFLTRLVLLGAVFILLFKILKKSIQSLNKKQKAYKQSEKYAFKKFISTISSQDKKLIIPYIYKWIDQFDLEEPTLIAFALKTRNASVIKEVKDIENQLKNNDTKLILNKVIWHSGRKSILKSNKITRVKSNWINP